jgi:hypothetical protein
MELCYNDYYYMGKLLEVMLTYEDAKILGCALLFFVCLLTFCEVIELLMGCLWCIWIWRYGLLHAIYVLGGLWKTKTRYKD